MYMHMYMYMYMHMYLYLYIYIYMLSTMLIEKGSCSSSSLSTLVLQDLHLIKLR